MAASPKHTCPRISVLKASFQVKALSSTHHLPGACSLLPPGVADTGAHPRVAAEMFSFWSRVAGQSCRRYKKKISVHPQPQSHLQSPLLVFFLQLFGSFQGDTHWSDTLHFRSHSQARRKGQVCWLNCPSHLLSPPPGSAKGWHL